MPEIRKDPLVGRWVVFSPERQIRPERYRCEEMPPTKPEEDPFLEGHESYTPPELYAIRPTGGSANGPGWQVRIDGRRFDVDSEIDSAGFGRVVRILCREVLA